MAMGAERRWVLGIEGKREREGREGMVWSGNKQPEEGCHPFLKAVFTTNHVGEGVWALWPTGQS